MSRAINNCNAEIFQNNVKVGLLKDVTVTLYETSCEASGEIVSASGMDLSVILTIRFEAKDKTKFEGDFYFNPYKIVDNIKYFDLTGALVII
jgi:hypothetical protein